MRAHPARPDPSTLELFPIDCRPERTVPGKSALETDFPAAMLSQLAEHESWRKEIHRPATHTHKWWAQRLGTVFRGILAAAVTNSASEAETAYSGALRLAGLTVFDPFAGSGTTLVEAAKAGASVVGWDINPVATLVQRQAVQSWDKDKLVRLYSQVERTCRGEIDSLHVTERGETVLYYFWVATAPCPDCRENVRLFSTQVFAQNAYPRRIPDAWVVCPQCLDIQKNRYDFNHATCANGHTFGRAGAVQGAFMTCGSGHRSKVIDALGERPPAMEMYAKLVQGFAGAKRYEPIDTFDKGLYSESEARLQGHREHLVLPAGRLETGYNTRQALRWGYGAWTDFFNDRQLYCLGLMATAIRDLEGHSPEREAIAVLFSGLLEFNNLFCSFKGEGTGAVRHIFSHHVLKPERTPLEAHPWGTSASSGAFSTLFRSRLLRAHEYKSQPVDHVMSQGTIGRTSSLALPLSRNIVSSWPREGLESQAAYLATGDSACTDVPSQCIDLVITDPPFMDNVHYSELADFFHAWLRGIQPFVGYSPTLTTRHSAEVQSESPEEFGLAIARVWQECHRVLRHDGLLAFTFHQARASGWVAVMLGLRSAGFHVTALHPVKGEMSSSVTKKGASEPSNLDSVIICRKGPAAPFALSIDEAEDKAMAALQRLSTARIPFGVADVKSVTRGAVLSLLTNNLHGDPRLLTDQAEAAAARITKGLGLE